MLLWLKGLQGVKKKIENTLARERTIKRRHKISFDVAFKFLKNAKNILSYFEFLNLRTLIHIHKVN